MKIAIDGPAGAGKSTIARKLSQRLGMVYLDTGAMYRAVALKMTQCRISPSDEASVAETLGTTQITVAYDKGAQRIILDGKDVSADIRRPEISTAASDFSALKCVRLKMVEMQRELAGRQDTVLDGRDIGTFVLPDAEVKIFLTASPDERARRRMGELRRKGLPCDFETVKKDIIQRDYNDSHRAFAPLKKADDAVEVDTTSLSIDGVTDKIIRIVEEKR